MAKTIIQTIGPLYGEVVNGTVFGRPNGSIYVPSENTISLSLPTGYVRNSANTPTRVYPCTDSGTQIYGAVKIIAQSQDNSAYMAIMFSDDVDFTSPAETNLNAGIFNVVRDSIAVYPDILDKTTYYVKAVLMSSNGVPVATSDVITVAGVVVS